ncbi:MAG: hypothetical protein N3B18_06600 [Desulfobacterota bacterium]|nr:hypothetical protein [Thermodesulfobacteriota bacterium]
MISTKMYGWHGAFLYIDLTSGHIEKRDFSEYLRSWIGGRALATRLYWDMVAPEIRAHDAENVLMVLPGPLAGTSAIACSRWIMAAKSPYLYPEQFAFGNAGGFLGAAIKKAGIDGMIITGKAPKLSYLYVDNGTVTISNAAFLRGATTEQTMHSLRATHGANVSIVCIGPAGEACVRFATAATDRGGSLSNGMGSVMGSKNLKALVVKGSGSVAVADPAALQNLNKKIRHLRKGQNEVLYLSEPMLKGIERGRTTPCYACPAGCTRAYFTHISGSHQVLQMCASSHYYNAWDQRYYGEPSEHTFTAIKQCNDLGLCTGEMTNLIWFLDACYTQGLLTPDTTGLPLEKIGSIEFITTLTDIIANRKGFGDRLAEGTRRLSLAMGNDAASLALRRITQHGYAADSYGPRIFYTNALLYATEARNPIIQLHEYSFTVMKWIFWYTTSGMMSSLSTERLRNLAQRVWGSADAVDFTSFTGKALAAFHIQNRSHAKEALVACDRFYPLLDSDKTDDGIGDPALEAKLFSAVTGIPLEESDYLAFGERAVNLQRAVALREGKNGRIDDRLNTFHFTDPIEHEEGLIGVFNPDLEFPGPNGTIVCIKGRTFDEAAFERMKDEYYRLRGWDVATGLPYEQTLRVHGLDFVCKELAEKQKLVQQ